ncbi:DNA/RNA polymerase [Trichodelitschia bisporula]|uniref:DNA/RNA polymerase n=1 Tax=Trichodelitschia bisporula TaxID=703511 RepID=A0A6G1HX02_9PEZI|nr:DNA/RNA polymerase [Trichodelitschia bisporula]
MDSGRSSKRRDHRIIIHFDYQSFYAAVFEAEDPSLKTVPFGVQQKQIIVTCNYEARKRGLHKLQLVRDAKKICPEVVILLGEDLSKFRDVSKRLYSFLRSFSWSNKLERLGFDEVFMDVTDMVDYNAELVNHRDLSNSFFCMSRDDPTVGFPFDASHVAGHTYPGHRNGAQIPESDTLLLRLRLGSHLASHIHAQLEEQMGYVSAVGISTSKLLSKLAGTMHKPRGLTTLLPPYVPQDDEPGNVILFMDQFDVGKVPNISSRMARKLQDHLSQRSPHGDQERTYQGPKGLTVRDVRTSPGMGPILLDRLLSGPGVPHGVGAKLWDLLNGIDNTEVGQARDVPRQISIEDSYGRLDKLEDVQLELGKLARSLIKRMRIDLTDDDDDADEKAEKEDERCPSNLPNAGTRRWLAYPKTLRLSTRPRPPANSDASRSYNHGRISRSAPMPPFMHNLTESVDTIAEKLVTDNLVPLFRRLHPKKDGWNLSLMNVAVTDMTEGAGDSKNASGRDIGKMFKAQEHSLKSWNAGEQDVPPPQNPGDMEILDPVVQRSTSSDWQGSEDTMPLSQSSQASYIHGGWESEEDGDDGRYSSELSLCTLCGARMPDFAYPAHQRFHEADDRGKPF